MNEKAITTAAMLWLGLVIVATKTNWAAKTAAFVTEKTHKDAPSAGSVQGDLSPGDFGRFALGYVGLWVVLAIMLDWEPTRVLATAFAVSIAGGATIIYGEPFVSKLGLAAGGKNA